MIEGCGIIIKNMEVDFMTYKEKENLLKIQNVTATMAIEGMYFNRDFLQKMMQVSRGELTTEEVRQEVIKKYAR
jgi:hypothetical protein